MTRVREEAERGRAHARTHNLWKPQVRTAGKYKTSQSLSETKSLKKETGNEKQVTLITGHDYLMRTRRQHHIRKVEILEVQK